MHKSDFSPFSDPFMLSVDASGVVPVGVRPPPPLRGSSPCEAGQFCIRMENRRGITARAEFIKSPLNFYCPLFLHVGTSGQVKGYKKYAASNTETAYRNTKTKLNF